MTTTDPFVLDRAENPHPRMLAGARAARRAARDNPHAGPSARAFWRGYLTAMADATGGEPDELEAWLDRHETDAVPRHRIRPTGA